MTRFHAADTGPLRTDTRFLIGLANLALGLFIAADVGLGLSPYAGRTTATSAVLAFAAILIGAWSIRDALEPRTPGAGDLREEVPRPDRWARQLVAARGFPRPDRWVRARAPEVRAWFGRGRR